MSAGASIIREQLAEPGRFWIRYAPRSWPGPSTEPWIDLAGGTLGGRGRREDLGSAREQLRRLEEVPLDDILYLPPVPPELAAARDRLARAHLERGTPVLAQWLPEGSIPGDGCVAVLDLLAVALESRGWRRGAPSGARLEVEVTMRRLPEAVPAAVAWPLLPGLGLPSQRPGLLDALVAAGARCLQGVVLELPARQIRALAEGFGEEAGLSLFHASSPSPLELARDAWQHGFDPYFPRPLPQPPLRGAGNLRLAGGLALAGELSMLRRDAPSRSQGFLRAARWAERSTHDLGAMAREGNLSLLHWLEEEPRRVLVAAADREPSELLRDLLESELQELGAAERTGATGAPT